jgi:hypothetical protein
VVLLLASVVPTEVVGGAAGGCLWRGDQKTPFLRLFASTKVEVS